MILIIVIDKKTGERYNVEDWMYFFEENFIKDINDHSEYDYEIYVDDNLVYPPNHKMKADDGESAG